MQWAPLRTQGLIPHVRAKITSIQQRGWYLWNKWGDTDIDFFQQLESAGLAPVFQHDRLEREREKAWWRKTAAGGHASQMVPLAQTPTTSATNILSFWNYKMTTRKENPSLASKTDLFHVFNSYVPSALEIYSDLKPFWPLILHSSMRTEIKSVWCWTQAGKAGRSGKAGWCRMERLHEH